MGLLESSKARDCELVILLDATAETSGNSYQASIDLALRQRGGAHLCHLPVPAISIRQQWKLADWVNKIGGDHYFYPHFDLPLGVRIPSTFVVHDLIPLKVSGYVQKLAWAKKLYFKEMIRSGVNRASRCIAVSETTRRDVLELVGSRFTNKVDVAFEGPILTADEAMPTIRPQDNRYLLYVGDRRPHKNIKRVIDLFFALREQHTYLGQLVLVGSTRNFGFDVEAYLRGKTNVLVAGQVTDAELSWYYRHAEALLFLSEYEGFGLPVVEAAVYNRKIVVSDGGSLAEIAPPSACIINRDVPITSAAQLVSDYLADHSPLDLATYLQQFTWTAAAKRIFPMAYAHRE